ncbi:2-hydroxyacid dehydrogenase [Pseudomonas sp. Z18(2022)]|uniref:2-hydroxyacid dehydrogenase n=1 Tax=Pseudomonas sp. Z18(2022) TaxID=2983410 RepID=UPI002E822DF8|nr:2-hydroxyacid dehydrogenase [Pseudomonas sp. Z18(2022)]
MDSRVFICSDSVQWQLLDALEAKLLSDGVDVVRGPSDAEGRRTYSSEDLALLSNVDVAVMTIRHDCNRDLLASSPRLRGLCFPTTGVESVDIVAANELNIAIAHGATQGNVIGIAEATIMLALNLLYDLRDSEWRMREGLKKPHYPKATALFGKTVGFVGFGRIAQAMASRLYAFGTTMLTYSPRLNPDRLTFGVKAVDLDTLMRESDVVFVLVSITPQSTQLIGRHELSLMKPSAFLVNTARGEAIDEAALEEVLENKRIAGAALDTFASEPLSRDSPLLAFDNVILTPHMVGQTKDAREEFLPAMHENVIRMLRGQVPRYLKNTEVSAAWLEKWNKC